MVLTDQRETAAQTLKHHTAEQHLALEQIMLPHLQSLQSLAGYHALLKKFYGYFKPVERLVEQQVDESVLADIRQRRKADFILHDLAFSNTHSEDLPLATALPEITNLYQGLGALYVLEGSTLGGRGITKMLLKYEWLPPEQVSFFAGYGADTGSMWLAFLNILNQNGTQPDAKEQMVAAANETFLFFRKWLS